MNLGDILSVAHLDVNSDVTLAHMIIALNRTIRKMNAKTGGIITLETAVDIKEVVDEQTLVLADADPDTITGTGFGATDLANGQYIHLPGSSENTGTYLSNTITNTVITLDASEALTAEASLDSQIVGIDVVSGYTWDHYNKKLTLANTIRELLRIYVDNILYEYKDYEDVKDSDLSDKYYFTMIGRTQVIFSSDSAGSDGDDIVIESKKGIDEVAYAATVTKSDTVSVPKQAEDVIYEGVKYFLLKSPNYKDAGDADEAKDVFIDALVGFVEAENARYPGAQHSPVYNY